MMRAERAGAGLLAVAMACAVAACGEKVPYPPTPARPKAPPGSPVDEPPGAAGASRAATAAIPGTAEVPPGPGTPELRPIRPAALVRTPDGSFVVSARPGGADLAVRKVPGLAFLRPDGQVAILKSSFEAARAAPGSPESRFLRLSFRADGKAVDVPLPDAADRPDLAAAGKADPDLAVAFFHRESLSPVGVFGTRAAYVAGVEGFLGGAHPYASKRLLVVDVATGRPDDESARFAGRDLPAEVLAAARETTCTRRPAGVAAVEGRGGEVAYVLGLAHDVESCAGEFRIVRVPGAAPEGPRPAASPGPGKDGVLRLSDTVTAGPVADWRLAAPGGAAVLLMGADKADRAPSPWEPGALRRNGASRELRYWEPGMAAPAVLGRASAVLSVQFLDGVGDAKKVLDALDRL